jgi:hypothetical protein
LLKGIFCCLSPLPERKIVDEIIPVEITAKATNDTGEKVKQKESEKKSPKLSFLAVVALKRKLARQRKKKKRKMSKDDKNKERNDEKPEVMLPEVSDKPEQSDIENEKYLTSFYLENETNFFAICKCFCTFFAENFTLSSFRHLTMFMHVCV